MSDHVTLGLIAVILVAAAVAIGYVRNVAKIHARHNMELRREREQFAPPRRHERQPYPGEPPAGFYGRPPLRRKKNGGGLKLVLACAAALIGFFAYSAHHAGTGPAGHPAARRPVPHPAVTGHAVTAASHFPMPPTFLIIGGILAVAGLLIWWHYRKRPAAA